MHKAGDFSMKLSREMLRSIIREAGCGDAAAAEVPLAPEPLELAVEPLSETSPGPVGDLMVEMQVATRALEQVVESVQNAAHLCHDCGNGVAAQAPIMEAMVTQAEALQEMLDAQNAIVTESASDESSLIDSIGALVEI